MAEEGSWSPDHGCNPTVINNVVINQSRGFHFSLALEAFKAPLLARGEGGWNNGGRSREKVSEAQIRGAGWIGAIRKRLRKIIIQSTSMATSHSSIQMFGLVPRSSPIGQCND